MIVFDYSKQIALNISFLMLKNHISREQISETLGYSEADMDRILSGQLILAPWALKDIACVLGVTKKDLMKKDMEEF
jgi:hypothetical protein